MRMMLSFQRQVEVTKRAKYAFPFHCYNKHDLKIVSLDIAVNVTSYWV